MSPGYSVCALCKEEEAIILQFIKYYLNEGAKEIKVYLDVGAPKLEKINDPRITIVNCSDLLALIGLTKRPDHVEEMQAIVYRHAFDTASSPWLLICDVDEFVGGPERLEETLKDVPANWHYIQLPVAEAVWGPGDDKSQPYGCTHFRTRSPKGFGKIQSLILYGRYWKCTVAGLVGHSLGKYFIRTGSPTKSLGIHSPYGEHLIGGSAHEIPRMEEVYLYHFDAISQSRWQTKWQGRLDNSRRSSGYNYNRATENYMEEFKRAVTPEDRHRLFCSLYEINELQRAVLAALRQLRRKNLW